MKRILVAMVLAMAVPSLIFGQAAEKNATSSSKSSAAPINKAERAELLQADRQEILDFLSR